MRAVSAPATMANAVVALTASMSRRSRAAASAIERGAQDRPSSVERSTVPLVPDAQIAPSGATLNPRSDALAGDGDGLCAQTTEASGSSSRTRLARRREKANMGGAIYSRAD